MRLFIVDDSEALRTRLIEIITEIEGIEVVGHTEDATKVIGFVERLKPDVVILDIQMPKGNGIRALDTIKKREKSPIVIMFTNYPYLQYRKRCMDLGADYFFYKAIEFEGLISLLNDLVRSAQR